MSKTLIVYYSFEGSTKRIAEAIGTYLNADLLRLKPKKEMTTGSFMKYVWGGKQAVMKQCPELENYTFDPSKYTTIIFGTPVWAGTYAPPIRTFLSNEFIQDKKIALFACHDGGPGKVFKKFRHILEGPNELIGDLSLLAPKKYMEDRKKEASAWAKTLPVG